MNYTMIMGHLGSDPDVRFTSGGQKVTSLRLASNQRRGGKDITIWWSVSVWGEQFDKMMPYLKKGTPLIVYGALQEAKTYPDKQGQQQVALNVIAHHLAFSPFGKMEKQEMQQHEHPMGGSDHSHGDHEPKMQHGHGEPQHAGFSDDEIPF